MAEQVEQDVRKLFKRWRGGDVKAGETMAQRFSDWYYAIIAVRLGDTAGREPLDRSCRAFGQGIVSVGRSAELIEWAHQIVAAELQAAGSRVKGGDFPNALTGNRSPIELLEKVRSQLSADHAHLLHLAYGHGSDLDALAEEAERQGGMPLALLQARYALKRALRDTESVSFQVVPDTPNLDLVPLPLYEADRMEAPEDEQDFEQWLISDHSLCLDVAEFATFSHALRSGAYGGAAPSAPVSPPPEVSYESDGVVAPTESEEMSTGGKAGLGIAAVLGGLLLLGLIAAVVAGIAFFALS